MLNQNRQPHGRPFQLVSLPAVPVDKILSYLTAEDLRSFHQVSFEWRQIVDSRPKETERRLNLVKEIRENKENIVNRPSRNERATSEIAALRTLRDRRRITMEGKKADGSPILMECTTYFHNTTPFKNYNPPTPNSRTLVTPPPSRISLQNHQEVARIPLKNCKSISSNEERDSSVSSSKKKRKSLLRRIARLV